MKAMEGFDQFGMKRFKHDAAGDLGADNVC
jgi:hypothetical protein